MYAAHLLSNDKENIVEIKKYLLVAASGGSSRAISTLLKNKKKLDLSEVEVEYWKFLQNIYIADLEPIKTWMDTPFYSGQFCSLLSLYDSAFLKSISHISREMSSQVSTITKKCAEIEILNM
ncbi:MAG: hypothetical protein Q9M92_10920 [Enterobacterales bacterium]|nr:hypothetical protein [Enterobacterales bacterium]